MTYWPTTARQAYALSVAGEIEHLPEAGFGNNLLVAGLPSSDPQNVDDRLARQASVSKYLRRSSNLDDRRDAVRGLADVLEYLRPQLKDVLHSKDEGDLFNIAANNFAIRHHNDRQRGNYDPNIWTSWVNRTPTGSPTIHAAQRMIQRAAASGSPSAG